MSEEGFGIVGPSNSLILVLFLACSSGAGAVSCHLEGRQRMSGICQSLPATPAASTTPMAAGSRRSSAITCRACARPRSRRQRRSTTSSSFGTARRRSPSPSRTPRRTRPRQKGRLPEAARSGARAGRLVFQLSPPRHAGCGHHVARRSSRPRGLDGLPGSGTEITARRVVSAAGLDLERDVTRRGIGPTQGADALKDGKLDALFWSGGLPTPAFLDLAHSPNVRMRLVPTATALDALRCCARRSLYVSRDSGRCVSRGGLGGAGRRRRQPARRPERHVRHLAYQLTRVLFERQADLAAVHPEAKKLSLPSAVKGSPLEFHPGAVRFYRERGAL